MSTYLGTVEGGYGKPSGVTFRQKVAFWADSVNSTTVNLHIHSYVTTENGYDGGTFANAQKVSSFNGTTFEDRLVGLPTNNGDWHGVDSHTVTLTRPPRGVSYLAYTAYTGGSGSYYESKVEGTFYWPSCTYSFNANGGTGAPSAQAKYALFGFTFPSTKPTRTGYDFLGWSTSSSATTASYTAGQTVSGISDSNTTFYAVWRLKTYAVTYNANGGSGAPGTQVKTHGVNLTLSTTKPTRSGYDFKGWATSSTGSVAYAAGGTYTANAAVTLYAVWAKSNYYVKFNANGGTGTMANEEFVIGTAKALTSNAFTRTGYTFAGWATSASGAVAYSNGQTVNNLTTTGGATVNLYAKWNPITYSVRFNPNFPSGVETSGSMGDESFTYDVPKALTTCGFSASEYAFAGWATSASGSPIYANSATVTNLASTATTVNLYAVWNCTHPSPSVTNLSVQRCDSDGTLNDEGTSMRVSAIFTVTAEGYSGGTVTVGYKERSASSWTRASEEVSGTSISWSKVIPGPFDIAKSYDVLVAFEDSFGAMGSASDILTNSFFTMDVLANGRGISFGAPCTEEGFHVDMDAEFGGDVSMANPLPIESGGTGVASKADLMKSLFNNSVSDPAYLLMLGGPWDSGCFRSLSQVRTLLNVLPLEGGGVIYANRDDGANLILKNTKGLDYTATSAPSADQWAGLLYFHDKNGQLTGFLRNRHATDNKFYTEIGVRRKVNGSNKSNYLRMSIDESGNLLYDMSNPAGFRNALGASSGTWPIGVGGTGRALSGTRSYLCMRILYENSSGSNGTITLSESAANFAYMEIYFRNNDSLHSSTGVYSPNGKSVSLLNAYVNNDQFYLKGKTVAISGTSITTSKYSEVGVQYSSPTNSNNIYITKVIGFV